MHTISRRSFFEVMAGSIVSLPVLAGGLIVDPTTALAEEGDDNEDFDYGALDGMDTGREAPAKYTIIDVVRPYEVGFIAVDVTQVVPDNNGKDSFQRVTGKKVHVKVISRYGDRKTAENDTNVDGIANINIKQLAENPKKQNVDNLESYAMNATVQVTCEGYRPFETSLMRVEGGTGLMVPLHPVDDKGVWPYRASFDEWDVLYTKNKFVRSVAQKDDHTIQIVARGVASTSSVTVELLVDGESKPRQSVQATPSNGEVTATFKAHFLQKGDAAALPLDKICKVVLHDGSATYAWTLALALEDAVVDEPVSKEGIKLSPFDTSSTSKPGADVKWPSSAPLVSGGSLKFWTPDLPVGLYVNPFGYAQFTIKSPSWGYQNDNGEVSKSGWGKYPVKSVSDQWNSMVKTATLMSDKTNALASKPGGIQQIDLFKNFSLKANFQFVACAKWDKEKNFFQGEASGQILVSANFSITENFFAGPIPVLISFGLDASFIAALNAACYSAAVKKDEPILDVITDISRWRWDYVNTGFTMTLNLTPFLSVGVGIRGVASISVKGSVTLTLFFGVPMGTQPAGVPGVHFTAGWSAQISLVLHLFLFTKNFTLKDFKYSSFYDNWKDKDKGITGQEDMAGAMLEAMSLDDIMTSMSIITDDMLRSTLDVKLNASGMSAQAEEAEVEPIDWDACMHEEVIALEDGTPMTYLVYDLNGTGEAAAAQPEPSVAEGQTSEADPAAVPQEPTQDDNASAVEPVEVVEQEMQPAAEGDAAAVLAGMAAVADAVVLEPATDSVEDAVAPESMVAQTEDDASGELLFDDVPQDEASDAAEEPMATDTMEESELPQDDSVAEEPTEDATSDQPVDGVEETPAEERQAQEDELQAQSEEDGESDGIWLAPMADGGLVNPGVASLGTHGGVRPSSDIKVFSNVFGDPRAKVLSVSAKAEYSNPSIITGRINFELKSTLSFRIAAVELADGKVRTRVVVNVIDGSERGLSRVIEFDTKAGAGIDHADLYDYDFDIDILNETRTSSIGPSLPSFPESGSGFVPVGPDLPGFPSGGEQESCTISYDMIAITLVSGRRQQGDNTPLANAATDLVFSCHLFYLMEILGYDMVGLKVKNPTTVIHPVSRGMTRMSFSMPGARVMGNDPSHVHSISSLQLVREGKSASDAKWLVSFLDRRASNAADVLGNVKGKVDIRLGVALWDHVNGKFVPISTESTHQKLGDIEDLSVFEHVLYPKIGNEFTLMLRGSEQSYYYLMSLDLAKVAFNSAKKCEAYDASVRLTYWPGNNAFLVSFPKDESQLKKAPRERDYSSWTLHKATWGGGDKPKLQMTPIGPENFNISSFALNDAGTFMFWPEARESDIDRVFDASGNPNERERAASYHVMACRMWKGSFSDPFIVADLPHDTDVLAVLKTSRGATIEMLGTEFVKGAQSLYNAANIWYTSVPSVRSATAVGCEAASAFVSPDANATFRVAIRNDGNAFIKGCKLTLCVKRADSNDFDRVESASASVTFSKDTIQESNWNPMVNGKLTNVEPDYALAPGKTSVHAVTVKIPADWQGEKKVLFVASEPVKADDGLTPQADGEQLVEVEFSIEPGDYQVIQSRMAPEDDYEMRYMDTLQVEPASEEETYWQSPVTVIENNGTKNGGISGGGGGKGGKGSKRLPDTGDHGNGALGVGMAALGAAVLAYERRRAENEGVDEQDA
ncbi:MAG: hypothetical protein J6D34_10745 [Atopobiaceae bacterium]|nr:hypothetical protein [Atopobiaceae bacterium]